MKRKILIRSLYFIGITTVLLVGTLIIHVAMVTKSKNDDKRNRQLARIDFKEQLDSMDIRKIKNSVLSMEGVDAAYFNSDDNLMVYSYDPELLHADLVYNKLMKENNIKAEKFSVSLKESANGCPVIDKSSFSYQFASAVENIMN